MSIRARVASIFIGLSTLGAVLTSGWEANGASITITGHQRPGSGDPIYEYIFDVTLQSNSTIQASDYFTINSLLGVTPPNFPALGDQGSSSSAPSTDWSPTIGPVTLSSSPYASDLTWTFSNSTPISAGSSPVDLGEFTVDTVSSFSSPPYLDGTLVYYTYNINGQTVSGGGSFPMTTVPEPASLIMLAMVSGVFLLLLPVYRQNCRCRQSRLFTA